MSSDFLLISPAAPHRTNEEGKYEILINASVAYDVALTRFKATSYPYFLESMSAETADIFDEEGNIDKEKFEEFLFDSVTSFVLECYDDQETALISYDKPRVFSGGMSWGDSPTEVWDLLAIIGDLQLFESPITDAEIGEYKPEHWRKVL
jgi:hypothetical protein